MQQKLEFDRIYLPGYVKKLIEGIIDHIKKEGKATSHLESQMPDLRLHMPHHYDTFYFDEDRETIPDTQHKVGMKEIDLPPEYRRWGEHYVSLYTRGGKIVEMKID